MMKAGKMNQNRQHKKTTIQERLRNLNISTQSPKNLDEYGVNLEGFKSIQNSFVVHVDEEIKKIQCKHKENIQKCDFILWVSNKRCVLIEVKSGKNIKSKVIGQFESTYNYLKKQNLVYNITCIFLLVGGTFSRSARKKLRNKKVLPQRHLNKIKHIKSGEDIFERLKDEINN